MGSRTSSTSLLVLNKEFLDKVKGPIQNTWNAIAADAEELGTVRNEDAIELCLDADRLTFFADRHNKEACEDAEEAIEAAIKALDYNVVLKFLSKNIQLI